MRNALTGRAVVWGSLGLVVILSSALRFYDLGRESLWMDELFQVSLYRLPIPRVVTAATSQTQPPLDYLIGAGLDRLGLADSDAWVRGPAAVFGVAGVLLLGWWVARIAGPAAGLTAAALLSVCPLHVAMSREARPYTIFVFLAMAAVLVFERARRVHTVRAWCAFAAVFLAMLLTRWTDPHFITISLLAYSAVCRLSSRRCADESLRRQEAERQWAAVTTIAAAYALYGPLFGMILARNQHYVRAGGASETGASWASGVAQMLLDTYASLFAGWSARTQHSAPANGAILLAAGGVACVGAILLLRLAVRRHEPAAWLFVATVLPFPLLYAAAYSRLGAVPAKPQYLLLMAAAVTACLALTADGARRALCRTGRWPAVCVWAAIVALAGIPMARASVNGLRAREKRDWRGAMTFLREHSRPGDAFASIGADPALTPGSAEVYGVDRYFRPSVRFLPIEGTLDTAVLGAAPWPNDGNTVWLLCRTDGERGGRELLPPPRDPPPGCRVHTFTRLFLLELRGEAPAARRLLDGLALLPHEKALAPFPERDAHALGVQASYLPQGAGRLPAPQRD